MQRMAGLAAWLWVALANGMAIAEGVVVELRSDVDVSRPLVLVRDVALLSGGTPAERNAIGSLDLVLLSENTPTAAISRRLIEVRMLVAGISPEAAEFTGGSELRVSLPGVVQASSDASPLDATTIEPADSTPIPNITDGLLEDSIARICSEILNCEITDVEVHLSQPVAAQALRGISQTDVELQIVPARNLSPGPNTMQVQFWNGSELLKTAQVRFELLVYQPVLVVNRFVPRGTPLSAEMVTAQHRPVNDSGFASGIEDIEGTETLRDLPAGTLLNCNMLRVTRTAQARPAVRTQDLVCVTLSQGALNISLVDAVAMQDGQPGDVIRVMNSGSRQILMAEVVGPGHVRIQSVR